MAVAGDILEQPETGWTRYKVSGDAIDYYPPISNDYPQISAWGGGILIDTTGQTGAKIKPGSKIRVIGKVQEPISWGTATSVLTTKIGTAPPTTIMQYSVMELTDNEYTLLAEIELTDVYFPQDSTYISIVGNREYGYEQGIIYYIDIETPITAISSLPSGTYTAPQTIELSCTTELTEIRYTTDGTEPTISSQLYSFPITIPISTTIKAKAFKTGYTESDILIIEIIITPIIPVAPIKYIQPPKITIKNNIVSMQSQYKIYYTTDGSYPNHTSQQYTQPFTIPQNTYTITAISYAFSHPTQQSLSPPKTTTIYPPQ